MAESPATEPSLLARICDARDGQAWTRFVEIYAPLIYAYARKHGLQDADAADVTQDALRAVARAIGRLEYDPEKGSFRGWLFTIVRNLLRNFGTSRQRQVVGTGDTSAQDLLEAQPAREDELAALWDQEYEQRLFTWAASQVKGGFEESTWQAFWQTAVEGNDAKAVAAALNLSVGAVYVSKSRVLARLRERIQFLHEM